MSEKTISISAVLVDLENGVTRKGIEDKYGINTKEVKYLFEHPKLKGKKAKSVFKPSFTINDDTESNIVAETVAEQEVVETVTQSENFE